MSQNKIFRSGFFVGAGPVLLAHYATSRALYCRIDWCQCHVHSWHAQMTIQSVCFIGWTMLMIRGAMSGLEVKNWTVQLSWYSYWTPVSPANEHGGRRNASEALTARNTPDCFSHYMERTSVFFILHNAEMTPRITQEWFLKKILQPQKMYIIFRNGFRIGIIMHEGDDVYCAIGKAQVFSGEN